MAMAARHRELFRSAAFSWHESNLRAAFGEPPNTTGQRPVLPGFQLAGRSRKREADAGGSPNTHPRSRPAGATGYFETGPTKHRAKEWRLARDGR
jgi:hypothetical protein